MNLIFLGVEYLCFSYVLGVMYFVGCMYDVFVLCSDGVLLIVEDCWECCVVCVVVFFYDVGYVFFSYIVEDCFEDGIDYEEMMWCFLVLFEIEQVFEEYGGGFELQQVCDFFEGCVEGLL